LAGTVEARVDTACSGARNAVLDGAAAAVLDVAAAALLVAAAALMVVRAELDVLVLELPHPASASRASGAAPRINLLFT
jgi:hypothetical protein